MTITVTATELEDFDAVEVIEVLVQAGDQVEQGQSLVTLESDKAMMEFPSPHAGVVKAVKVSEGDKISQGDPLVELEEASESEKEDDSEPPAPANGEQDQEKSAPQEASTSDEPEAQAVTTEEPQSGQDITVTATELEDFDAVEVIEVLVQAGDQVEQGQSLVTLESDKAMMEFPSPQAGVVKAVKVSEGDKISQGDPLVVIASKVTKPRTQDKPVEKEASDDSPSTTSTPGDSEQRTKDDKEFTADAGYASPGVRKYARELGIDISTVKGSAEHGRVTKADVQKHVQQLGKTSGRSAVPGMDKKLSDFSRFGEIEIEPLNRLRKASASHLQHAWQVAPHVTQFDDVDITDLETARKKLKSEVDDEHTKLTILPFVMKALVKSLQAFPRVNSSLNKDATELVLKKYYHIGIAVDTPDGLVVPVFRDVDQKKIPELAKELMEVSQKARAGKLGAKEMQGGCMTITSLGGIGGRHFTPIINFPEVAILGVSRSFTQVQSMDGQFVERLILPLSLSYDHRAIDGAEAAAFITDLKNRLNDIWSLII